MSIIITHGTRRSALGRITVTLLAAAAIAPAAAAAETDTSTVTVEGASVPTLTAPSFGDFPDVTLNGSRQTVSASVASWSVTDARGTGLGWDVRVSATVPTTVDESESLATATMALTAPAASAADPQNASAAPALAGGNIIGSGVLVADADAAEGMGVWNLAQGADDLDLSVPSDAKAGTYTSTITTTLTPGA